MYFWLRKGVKSRGASLFVLIDREAGEIIRSVASICLCVCLSVRALLLMLYLALPSTAKGAMKHKSGTLLKTSSQGMFQMVVYVSTNLLLFRQVVRLRSITLLIVF